MLLLHQYKRTLLRYNPKPSVDNVLINVTLHRTTFFLSHQGIGSSIFRYALLSILGPCAVKERGI